MIALNIKIRLPTNIFNVSLLSALTITKQASLKATYFATKPYISKTSAKLFYNLYSNINVARGPGLETQLPQSRSVHLTSVCESNSRGLEEVGPNFSENFKLFGFVIIFL